MRRTVYFLLVAFLSISALDTSPAAAAESLVWPLGDATLTLSLDGKAQIARGEENLAPPVSAFALMTTDGRTLEAKRVEKKSPDTFDVIFPDGTRASLNAMSQNGFVLFKLTALDTKSDVVEFSLFRIGVPNETDYAGEINHAIFDDGFRVGVMTAAVNTRPVGLSIGGAKGDNKDCSHSFVPTNRAEADPNAAFGDGEICAEFRAESKRSDGAGWSIRGKNFDESVDLSGCRAIRARIFGDGKGEALKIQLGGKSGHRDDYISIDFTGWKTVTCESPALNDMTYDDVRRLNFYYNGLPNETCVRCLIDRVEAVFGEGADERTVLLEDFESAQLPYWDSPSRVLSVSTYKRHKLFPAQFAVIASTKSGWPDTIERMQAAAEAPSPKPGGAWRDKSPWVHQSYFFLTYFNVNEYDTALAFTKRGGFKQILLLQNSWCATTGHYRVNENNFPGGLDTLRQTIEKFRAEGIRFGLHFLAASIDPPDEYLTPIPDKRFVTGVSADLAADLDTASTEIQTVGDSSIFPSGEDPYLGSGQVVRIDDELIAYGKTDASGLAECTRGLYGTIIAPHKKGTPVTHFVRSYVYHMYDLDTDLTEDIAANFARVANALPLDMIYFDGSERLQRPNDDADHWYYNARLHRAFFDAVENKNILYQGSSCSPCSWHQLLRSASADGHDDLKAYLEERSNGFLSMAANDMPLDIGWYYGYDRNATPDMYEYVLGATIGYDSSMSFQASVSAAMKHPFIGEILDMIRTYEELRLSGKIPAELREQFRIDPILAGTKSVEERNALLAKRNDFHLETADGAQQFRRVLYPLWQEVSDDDTSRTWELTVTQPCRVGLQVHFKETPKTEEETLASPKIEIAGDHFSAELALPMKLTVGQYGFALPNEKLTQYGLPLAEPVKTDATPDIRLEPGTYRVTFSADGAGIPIRVRTPLYTDETWNIK